MSKEEILQEAREDNFNFSDYQLLNIIDATLDYMFSDSPLPLEKVGYSIRMLSTIAAQLERRHENG